MINVNKFLQNSHQLDLMGENILTYNYDSNKLGKESLNYWESPNFAMQGQFIAGFETEAKDFLQLSIKIDGKTIKFSPTRHIYTPAYQDTIYCSESGIEGYKPSGVVCVREEKCILKDSDNFISRLTFYNEGKTDKKVQLKVNSKYIKNGVFKGETLPGALGKHYNITLYCHTFINDNEGSEITFNIGKEKSVSIIYGVCFSPISLENAKNSFNEIKEKYINELEGNYISPKFILDNEKLFNKWFEENVPSFESENEELKKVYYYRWFLLYKNTHTPKKVISEVPFDGEVMYESPAGRWFGCPIGLSVPLHIEEAKWLNTSTIAYSDALNFANHRGNYHAYIQYTPMAIWHLYQKYPNKEFIKNNFDSICAYTKKQISKSDESGVPSTYGSWVTGAEYQPAFYEHAEPKWDWLQDDEGIRLGGYDATKIYRLDEISYLMQNCYGTAKLAKIVNKEDEYNYFYDKYLFYKDYLIKNHYDKESGLFFDKDKKTGNLCKESLGYDSFATYMFNILDFDEGINNLAQALKDEGKLLTNFGNTTISKENPMYWFGNCIVGPFRASIEEPHFYSCCWNGPVWPYASSIVLEGLGNISQKDNEFKSLWLDMFDRYTKLHFLYGDRSTPTIKEHYRGSNGLTYSCFHDYFHSVWLDLFFKYYVGININEKGVSINSFAKEDFTIGNIVVKGKKYKIVKKGNKVKIN